MEDMNVAFGRALTAMGRKHPDVVVLDADLNTSTKSAFFLEEFPERFVQLGIAEQNMMGVAAGMSIGEGFIPFAVTFAAFASKRPCDQVSISVAYQKANVKIVGTYAGISLGKGGTTHQSVEDIAIMRAIPGMYVADPGWPGEIAEVLEAAVARQGPVYIRLSAGTFPDLENGALQAPKRFTWGKARWFARGGKDTAATVVTTGIMIHRALSAARRLREEGISVAVVHCPGIEPMDIDSMKEIADMGRPVITVENHGVRGGLGDAVSQIVESYRPVPLLRMGVKNSFGQTARETEELFRRHGLTEADIAAEVKRCMAH
jgi:transketolase